VKNEQSSLDNRPKAVFLFPVNSDRFLSNLHPLTTLSRGGFSLDSIQTNFKREKLMEPTNDNGSLLRAGQLVTCRLDELRPHPSYVRHCLTVPARQLSALAERGDRAFSQPLVVARDHTILDGYAQFELARMQGRATLQCVAYELTESEALYLLLERHRRSDGLNAFCRVLLALELEPWLKEKARLNQQAGGQNKGSSRLTEASRLDVRREIAAAAGVCPANVSKVKQLTMTARPQLLRALRGQEISIHRAWLWSKEPSDKQLVELRRYQDNRSTNKIKRLILRHKSKGIAVAVDPGGVLKRLAGLGPNELATVSVRTVNGSGKAIYLTEDLIHSLSPYQEQMEI
jgi:hypothetical protein